MRQLRASKADEDSSAAAFRKLVCEYMRGPSDFTSSGTLKHCDATPWLRAIKIPTLFIIREFVEATPSSTRRFSSLVPGGEFVMIPGSGHVTHNDNFEALLAAVRAFHTRVENR